MSEQKTVWIINQYASTPQYGLGGRHFYLAQELAKLGHRVYVIAAAPHHLLHKKPVFDSDFSIEAVAGFSFVWLKMPPYAQAHSKQRVLNWFLFAWRLRRLAKIIPHQPDAVLCSSPSLIAFLGAQRLAKKYQARLVFEVRDIWPQTLIELGGHSPNHPLIRLMQWVENKAYRDADRVVSNLKNSVKHMVAHGLRHDKFAWVPNGFSQDEVRSPEPLSASVAAQLPQEKFIVGYTGTLGLANSLDTLILAAEILQAQTDIVFVIVGKGREKEPLAAMVKGRGLKNFIFIDAIPKTQIQSMLARFDACFIGLTKDPLFRFGVSPNKLFDYLYAGKPIVYAIESGDYQPVAEAKAGLQVAPQDPQALAAAILQLYRMPAPEREKMGHNGHQAALAQYEYGMLAQQLAAVLFNATDTAAENQVGKKSWRLL